MDGDFIICGLHLKVMGGFRLINLWRDYHE